MVDGTTYTSAQTFSWTVGSTHTLATVVTQSPATGIQDVWSNWSDAGAVSHTVTAPANATTYTANFQTQYLLTTVAGTGGTISPATGYFNANATVQTTATANTGYQFTGFSGAITGTTNPQPVTMTGPLSVTANFAAATTTATIQTSPAGLSFMVDGTTYTSAQTFNWTVGSTHTIATAATQTPATGTQDVWSNWSDGGAASHTVTASATATTYMANFQTQYLLTTVAGTGGTISPATGYFNANATVQTTAAANTGYQFTGFSGALTGTTNPQSVTMTGPLTVTANFGPVVYTQFQTTPPGLTYSVDGTSYTGQQTFAWLAGSTHSLSTAALQTPSAGTQEVFQMWTDGGTATHTFTTPSTPRTFWANFQTQYLLTTQAGTGGTVSPSTGYVNANAAVPITATANSGYQFSGFSGAITGTANPQTLTLTGPLTVTASFTPAAAATTTVQTSPAGLSFKVDGTTYTSAQTFSWVVGSTHTIATTATQTPSSGTQDVWSGWSDGGAVSHTVIAGSSSTTYTAKFQTQYLLTTKAGTGGTISPATGYFNANATVQTKATASNGYLFSGFSGALTGTTNPQSVTMTGPLTVTANFGPVVYTQFQTTPPGLTYSVDGTSYTGQQTFAWLAGSTHTLSTSTLQTPSAGTQEVFQTWTDGGAATHTFTTPSTARTFWANFQTQYLLTTQAGTGGTISPATGYVNANAAVPITAGANAGYQFSGFSGALTGTANPQTLTINGPLTVTASFTAATTTTSAPTPSADMSSDLLRHPQH
jgi:hypothetical protein